VPCRATSVGGEAWKQLNSPDFCGSTLAVFPDVVYLQSDSGQVLWLQKESLPMHRRSIRAGFPDFLFKPGKRFSIRKPCLCLDEETAVDLAGAAEWNPPFIRAGEEIPPAELRNRIRYLLTSLPGIESPEGFGKVLPLLSAMVMNLPAPSLEFDVLPKGAIEPIAEVVKGCLAGDPVRIAQKSRDLVGLGQGLTPSGDDFVGGLFFAGRRLQEVYGEEVSWDGNAVNDFVVWAANRTNPISHALLSDLALGEGPAPLHDLFNAAVSSKDFHAAQMSLDHLCEIGSTSGWDMLTGFMTGMLMIENALN
jgi:hypothetical protein